MRVGWLNKTVSEISKKGVAISFERVTSPDQLSSNNLVITVNGIPIINRATHNILSVTPERDQVGNLLEQGQLNSEAIADLRIAHRRDASALPIMLLGIEYYLTNNGTSPHQRDILEMTMIAAARLLNPQHYDRELIA